MATAPVLDPAAQAEADLHAYLAADRAKPLLRFVTCGSVDDGKSTLIGRLLHDSKRLFADQLSTLESDSRRFGTRGGKLDFALLVDGLAAEREQGITIDVAYRFFASDRRKFIVADAPGHEQYTRNMATAASTADLAVILIDATKGVLPQTRRHSHIVRLLGVRRVVLAVNKMDLAGYDRARFDAIVGDYAAFAQGIGIADFAAIPLVAVDGDNVAHRSTAMSWYGGPTLVEALEQAPIAAAGADGVFAMPVQWVNRPDATFRGFSGTIARGTVAVGDAVAVSPGGGASRIARIVTFDGDLAQARAGQAVTLVLADEIECAAGSMIQAADGDIGSGDAITADLVWLDENPAQDARYLLQQVAGSTWARIDAVEEVVAIPGAPVAAGLVTNAIARVRIVADRPIAATAYADNRELGAFVLIDRATHATVAAGMIRTLGTAQARASSAAIYTLAGEAPAQVIAQLREAGTVAALLDEARLREGVAADLAADAGTTELWRRGAAVARLLAEHGVTVVLALDAPAGADPVGLPWPGASSEPDWVI
jgi:bifunctional enzyme CysN/CysC